MKISDESKPNPDFNPNNAIDSSNKYEICFFHRKKALKTFASEALVKYSRNIF